ncbi:MAG: tRNA (adenosine(37)-N6)-dimethylallyltransferase [Solirubrobacteraceae bacterium]|jgi:tRNA dimethylallyltransferase
MQVIALFGPTGVGKTAVALALARRLRQRGEDPVAVSADALQVYAGLETLTGVASAREQAELEHRLVSFVPLLQTFSAGRYAKLAHAEIDGLLAEGRRPIVVGGTGLYLRAALTDLDFKPPPPGEMSQLWSEEVRRPTLLVGLTMERAALYAQIEVRVQAMLEAGVREEVRRAREAGVSRTARKALGFEELLADDVEAMKRHTRNYAKRQMTWMRKLAGVRVIDVTGRDADAVALEILDSGAG